MAGRNYLADSRDGISVVGRGLAARASSALFALTLSASSAFASPIADWEELPLDQALVKIERASSNELAQLHELATELLELNPERWHLLRANASYFLHYDLNDFSLLPKGDPAGKRFAKAGISSFGWLFENKLPGLEDPSWKMCSLAIYLYQSGLGLDPETEAAFRTVFEHASEDYVILATEILIEYLQANVGDDPCDAVLAQALERTASLRAADSVGVLSLDLVGSRIEMRKGRSSNALRIAKRVMDKLLALSAADQTNYVGLIVRARESVADCELDLALTADVVRGNEAILARNELFESEASREYLLMQIALALVQANDLSLGERSKAFPILEKLATESENVFRRYLANALLGFLSLDFGDASRAVEFARAAARIEAEGKGEGKDDDGFVAPTLERAFRLAVGLRAYRLVAAEEAAEQEAEKQAWRLQLETAVEKLCVEWSKEVHDVGGESNLLDLRTRFAIVELLEYQASEQGPEVALETLSRIHDTSLLASSLGAQSCGMSEIQKHLVRPGSGVLVFFFGRGETIAIAVDSDGIIFERTESGFLVIEDSRRFASLLRNSPLTPVPGRARTLLETGKRLSDAIVPASIRKRMRGWDHALLIGGDVLAGGTLGALPLLSDRPLSVDLAITHAPSLPVAVHLAKRAETLVRPKFDAVLVLEVEHSEKARSRFPGLLPIEFLEEQRTQLVDSLPNRTKVLRGAKASWSNTLAAAKDATLLELFTHGLSDSSLPIPAGFLLSPGGGSDGIHSWSDVQEQRLPPWVVLATCASGVGELRIGDEAASDLRGPFLEAGALGIVHTYGMVDAFVTRELLVEAHRALAKGQTLSAAFREAREVLWERGEYRDPFYLTLVQVFGAGDRAPFPAPTKKK